MAKHYSFYALLDRLRYIERWSLMRSNQRETVADHTYQVSYIVHALYQIWCAEHPGEEPPVDLGQLLARTIFHDSSEVLTGDLPTPIKYFSDELRAAYAEIEHIAEESMLKTLPEEYRALYARPMGLEPLEDEREEQQLRLWLKAADSISAYLKCKEEIRLGNNEFADAALSTKQKIHGLNCPEAEIFLEVFVPTYEASLDELKESFDARRNG